LFQQNEYSPPWSQGPRRSCLQDKESSVPWSQDPLTLILLAEVRLRTMVKRPHHFCLQERKLRSMVKRPHHFYPFSGSKVKDHGHKTPLLPSSVKGRFSTTVTRPHKIYPKEIEPKTKLHIVLHAILIL
jgi:hypothetical protein